AVHGRRTVVRDRRVLLLEFLDPLDDAGRAREPPEEARLRGLRAIQRLARRGLDLASRAEECRRIATQLAPQIGQRGGPERLLPDARHLGVDSRQLFQADAMD